MARKLEVITTKDEFQEELTAKFKETFPSLVKGPRKNAKVLHKFDMLDRLGIETVIYNSPHLESAQRFPITQLDSEILIQNNQSINYREYLALILYDRSLGGANELQAEALYQDLLQNRENLNLGIYDLHSRLLIQRAGLTYDGNMPYGIRPTILLGVTQVFSPEVLNSANVPLYFPFILGTDKGLPKKLHYLTDSKRILHLPSIGDRGLRVLTRLSNNDLDAAVKDLRSNEKGKITFVNKDKKGSIF